MEPPKTPLTFMKSRPAVPGSIPTKVTINFVLPYKVELSNKEIGKTKVFLRAGQMAELDVRRTEVLGNSAKIIQCKVRSYIARKEFLALCNAAIDIQALWRGNLTCKFYNNMRREAVAVRIQKHVCRYKAQKAQKAQKHSADTEARAQIEILESEPLSMKSLLLRLFH